MMLTFIIIHGGTWHVFKWIGMVFPSFTWSKCQNRRPSIYPCNYKSFPPLFFLLSFFLSPFLFLLFLSSLPPFLILFIFKFVTNAWRKYQSSSNIWQEFKFSLQRESPNFYLVKTFILLSLLFPVLSKMPCTSRKREKKLKPGRSLNCNVSIQKNTEVSTIIIGNSM